jgi:L-fuconolactonase
MAKLRRDFLVDDLSAEMQRAGMDGAITVQAERNVAETEWLLACAESNPELCGVVGWAPLDEISVAERLDELCEREKLVGFREIVQAEAAGFLDREEFNRGIAELTRRGLAYDILIRRDQLEEATRFVDRHPNQRFVLDHLAKPGIAAGEMEPWRGQLRELARRENVCCKVSGMVTEAEWTSWTNEDLKPYLDAVVEGFGARRLLAGSDWPVCLVASSYSGWWGVLDEYFADFSQDERTNIFGGNAMAFYRVRAGDASSREVSGADRHND